VAALIATGESGAEAIAVNNSKTMDYIALFIFSSTFSPLFSPSNKKITKKGN